MTRKIKIYSTVGMPGTIETNVLTLSELKPLLKSRGINYDEMKMLVGETKNELSMDEATLPEGDFKLYLMPAKTKSGVDFEEMSVTINEVERAVEELRSTLEEVYNLVRRFYDSLNVKTADISAEDQREIDELRRLAGEKTSEWDD